MADTMNIGSPTPSSNDSRSTGAIIGLIACRVVVPLWVLTGALFKLNELDWKLLPPPVRSTCEWVGSLIGQDPDLWLGLSMRFLIGTELMLVGLMFASTRLARPIAAATLALFIVILTIVLAQGYDSEKGLASLIGGDCGCFGSAGPPASVMLLIDALLLGCVLFFKPGSAGRQSPAYLIGALAVSAVIGYTLAFLAPERTIANTSQAGNTTQSGPQVDERGWILPPATLKPNYYPRFEEWVGKRLQDQELAQLMPRPIPLDLNTGENLIIFYRGDCDHCQEMFLAYFSDPQLPTPTLAVDVMDYAPEGLLEFYCDACERTELPSGPSYLIQTPVVVRVRDGVVTCIADGANTDEELEDCIYGLNPN
ncbi:MAG: hypothetical protein VX641_01405 [Planctomycetota bacterium]|nr:hypothetical protein [Planctomycetota bacterium]